MSSSSVLRSLAEVLAHITVTTFNRDGEPADPPHPQDLGRCGVQFGTDGDTIPLSDTRFERIDVGTYRLWAWFPNDQAHDPWDLDFYGITEGPCYISGVIKFESCNGVTTDPGVE